MLLPMLHLSLLWAVMPSISLAFPTGSSGLGASKTLPDRLIGRDHALHERAAESTASVARARTVLIPTSIDPTDNTPIYSLPNSNTLGVHDIFGNLTSPAANSPSGPLGPDSIINFKWGFGPVIVSGRIDKDTLDTDITVWIYGIKLGEFHGNLVTGVVVDINLRFVKGEIKVYLRNKNEVWLHLSLEFSFGKKLEKDVKILTLPDLPVRSVPPTLNQVTSPEISGVATDATATA